MHQPASPPAAPAMSGSRFTRVLYVVALLLGGIALGVRLVRGLRTGSVAWLDMSLPASVLLMLTAIMVGPRRPWLYYPFLVASFGLLVSFYVLPHHVRAPGTPRGAFQPPAPSAAPPRAR